MPLRIKPIETPVGRAGQIFRWYAKRVGKRVRDLTAMDKQVALMAVIMLSVPDLRPLEEAGNHALEN